jgi:hypothetical protein
MSSGMIGTIKRRSMILSKPSNKTWTAALLMVLTANSAYTQSATDKHMQPLTVRFPGRQAGMTHLFSSRRRRAGSRIVA